jgi:hypothetical protein
VIRPINREKQKKAATPPPRAAAICAASMEDINRRSVKIMAANAPCETIMGSDSLSSSRKVFSDRVFTEKAEPVLQSWWKSREYTREKDGKGRGRCHSMFRQSSSKGWCQIGNACCQGGGVKRNSRAITRSMTTQANAEALYK